MVLCVCAFFVSGCLLCVSVSVCVYLSVSVYLSVYMYVCLCVCAYMFVHVYEYMSIVHVCMKFGEGWVQRRGGGKR